jgi:hypothetical protein
VALEGIDDDLTLALAGISYLRLDSLHERDWAVEGNSGVGVFPTLFDLG